MSRRKAYEKAFIEDAVQLVAEYPDRTVKTVAAQLGVPQTVLNNWVRRAGVRSMKKAKSGKTRAEPKAERAPRVGLEQRVKELETEL